MVEVKELLREVGRLQWRLGRPVEGLLIGGYRSVVRGEGIEFADARPYVPGEPWRRIHWALSARRGEPYVWLGMEERQLTCSIALDLSASMTTYSEKLRQAAIAGTMIALTALKAGDKVQWLAFTDKVVFSVPPRRHEPFVWGALEKLLHQRPATMHTRLRPLLHYYMQLRRRSGLLVLLTDGFWQDGPEALHILRAVAQKHFILVLYVRHPREMMHLPFGRLPYREVETGRVGVAGGTLEPPTFPQASLRQALLPTHAPAWQVLMRTLGSAPL